MSKHLLCWTSDRLTTAQVLNLCPGIDTLVSDDPHPTWPLHHWLRVPRRLALQLSQDDEKQAYYWQQRWGDAACEMLAIDELKVGHEAHSVESWGAQLRYLHYRVQAYTDRRARVCLTWSALWGVDVPEIVATLKRLTPYVDVWAVQTYIDCVNCDRMLERAKALINASVEAGVWEQTYFLLNLSDRREWFAAPDPETGEPTYHYAVFGPFGEHVDRVYEAYAELWRHAASKGRPLGLGVWSGNYWTATSSAVLRRLLARRLTPDHDTWFEVVT